MRDVRMTPHLRCSCQLSDYWRRSAVGEYWLISRTSGKVSAPLRAPNTYACCNMSIKILCEVSTSQICSVNELLNRMTSSV